MTVVTRFAPSPTGYLHIGGARTALFNWLFAKHHNGKFLLRIEDTDKERSTPEATAAILTGLKWLGLDWDGAEYYQSKHEKRHAEVAQEMLAQGKAFKCYHTQDELKEFREGNKAGRKFMSQWRPGPNKLPDAEDKPYVVRLYVPHDDNLENDAPGEETVIEDHVQGRVVVKNNRLDDLVMLRADGSPVYMLAVVVDDHDMGVTHVIRGDDHLTNAFKQKVIYQAMGWNVPEFAHIPLIHGADGAKLSKRHGALGVEEYEKMGYLPEAMRNYLLRLGWAHGDDEIISTEQAIEWFGLEGAGKSPSRFDFARLDNLNGHYIREADDARLIDLVLARIGNVDAAGKARILKGMASLKQRAKTLKELAENAIFYTLSAPIALEDKAKEMLDKGGWELIRELVPLFEASEWTQGSLENTARGFAETKGQKLGNIAQPLRAALTGKMVSPGVFEVMEVLGKEETLKRLRI